MSFTSRLTAIFRPYLNKFLVLYLNDLLIFSKTYEDHMTHVDIVLSKLEEYSLVLSPSKWKFATHSATYLGHEISQQGVQPSVEHVKSVKCTPEPKNLSQLKSQLCLFQFFHSFIPERGSPSSQTHQERCRFYLVKRMLREFSVSERYSVFKTAPTSC